MSGHSKWSTIKRKKGAADAKKGQLFTKLGREITLAARKGGDPQSNFALRLAVDKARAANMPKENIERAIQRGSGELKGEQLDEFIYEGYGPSGTGLLIQVVTDNRNRAVAEIRRIMTRQNGRLAEGGGVAWMFDQKGVITIEAGGRDPDELALQAIDLGAEDVKVDNGLVEIYTTPKDLPWVKEALEKRGIKYESAQLAMVPKTLTPVNEEATLKTMRLIEALEELDDVQQVYSNLDISDAVMAKYQG